MDKAKPGWEKRVEELGQDEFVSEVRWSYGLEQQLSVEELAALGQLLNLVDQAAERMATNMLKGIIKYGATNAREKTLEEWFEHLLDDGTDAYNYQILLWDAYKRAKNEDK